VSGNIDDNLGESASAIEQALEAAAIVDSRADADPDGDWVDSLVALDFRGSMSSMSGDIPAALLDADRLSRLSGEPTGWARYFSAHLRAMVLFPQWTEESMAATVAAAEAARSVCELADVIPKMLLGTQLYRVGRHEEALAVALTCLDSPTLLESGRIRQVPAAVRPLVALGRYQEALDIIETDFGPMLDAQHHNLRVNQLFGLTTVLHGLDQIEPRDHLATTAFRLRGWDFGFDFTAFLDHIYVNEETLAVLPEPDPTELTSEGVTALISGAITEIRDHISHGSPAPPANAPTKAT
jgi:hypothetical protein